MISSGTTPLATTDDTAVAVLSDTLGGNRKLYVINEGTAPGFFTIDGGGTWGRLSANIAVVLPIAVGTGIDVRVKRTAGGANLSGVYAFAG